MPASTTFRLFREAVGPRSFRSKCTGRTWKRLAKYSDELIERLRQVGGLSDLDTTLALRKPELQVVVDREAASDLGISVGTIADSLRILVGGMPVSTFRDAGEQYDVWLRAQPGDRSSVQDLYGLSVTSPTVGAVSLSNLARLEEQRGPSQIERKDRQRLVTVLANPDGIALGEAVTRSRAVLEEMNLPPAYSFNFGGQAETLAETGYYLVIAFVLSILFMYLILSAQFESWSQPIAILMALPVTIPFGLLSLVIARTPMDIYAMFGLFMLVGIVKKNGILQIDATNRLRQARHAAARSRCRGQSHPAAADPDDHGHARRRHDSRRLGTGPGSGRASMAKVIIGGQSLRLVGKLIVTPVFYVLLIASATSCIALAFASRSSSRPAPLPRAPPPSVDPPERTTNWPRKAWSHDLAPSAMTSFARRRWLRSSHCRSRSVKAI